MPSRCALLRMAATGRWSLMLITPVGVLPFASCLSIRTSAVDHGWRERRLYDGFALRGPFLPIGDPGRFHAALAISFLQKRLRHESAPLFPDEGAYSAAQTSEAAGTAANCATTACGK